MRHCTLRTLALRNPIANRASEVSEGEEELQEGLVEGFPALRQKMKRDLNSERPPEIRRRPQLRATNQWPSRAGLL
jgi:hypothetical protein